MFVVSTSSSFALVFASPRELRNVAAQLAGQAEGIERDQVPAPYVYQIAGPPLGRGALEALVRGTKAGAAHIMAFLPEPEIGPAGMPAAGSDADANKGPDGIPG